MIDPTAVRQCCGSQDSLAKVRPPEKEHGAQKSRVSQGVPYCADLGRLSGRCLCSVRSQDAAKGQADAIKREDAIFEERPGSTDTPTAGYLLRAERDMLEGRWVTSLAS